jgi:hypothetical protein
MIASGMKTLTGDARPEDAWARFISPKDVVGIKVNCSGAPRIRSSPEMVAVIAENLIAVGVPAKQIYVYERFDNQLQTVGYGKYLPAGVNIYAAETTRGAILGYDPKTYVETSFFGEDDTRSNVVRLVAETLHQDRQRAQPEGAPGVRRDGLPEEYLLRQLFQRRPFAQHPEDLPGTFIGTLAAVEPVRSRVVLNIMDGLARSLARRPVQRNAAFPLLIPNRSCSARTRWPWTTNSSKRSRRNARPKAPFPSSTVPCPMSARTIATRIRITISASPATWSTRRNSGWASSTLRQNQTQGDRTVMLLTAGGSYRRCSGMGRRTPRPCCATPESSRSWCRRRAWLRGRAFPALWRKRRTSQGAVKLLRPR